MIQMKFFLTRLAVFICICLVLAYSLQWVADTGLKKSDFSIDYKEWNDITESRINADIIVLGSSKAWKQVSPKEFEQNFKLSTYNLGMDGHDFPMQKWRFDTYLKYNSKPKFVIQIIALNELSNPQIEFHYIQFIPYLNRDYIKTFGGHSYLSYLDFYIPLYKYCHNTGTLETGLISFFSKHQKGNNKYKGFLSTNAHWDNKDLTAIKKKYPNGITAQIDPVANADFIDLIRTCKKENIDLILVYPPTTDIFQNMIVNRSEIMNFYQNLSAVYKLKYLNYSKDTICADTAMFYNFNHLNTRGVTIFNKQLINDLKDEIK